jgi:hypothetical protein
LASETEQKEDERKKSWELEKTEDIPFAGDRIKVPTK